MSKQQYIDELRKRYGNSPELQELELRYVGSATDELQRTTQNRLLASSYLADEIGSDADTVNASWDKITLEKYGKPMSPEAVFDDLEQRGIVATPNANNNFIRADVEEALEGRVLTEDEQAAKDRKKLVRNTADYFSYLDRSEEVVGIKRGVDLLPFPFPVPIPGERETVSVRDIIDSKKVLPAGTIGMETDADAEDLLDITTFTKMLRDTASRSQAEDLYAKRRQAIQNHRSDIIRDQEEAVMRMQATKADSDAFFEFYKGLTTGAASVARGVGAFSVWAGMGWNEQAVEDMNDVLDRAELTPSQAAGKLGYVTNTVGQALPYFATMASGGWGATFMTEFGNAYADNPDSSESMRTLEATAIALPNTIIESMQLDKWFKFAKAGRSSFASFRKSLQDRAYKEILKGGTRAIGQSMSMALNEGIEELLQQGVQLSVPAVLRGEYPRTPEGNADWATILDQSVGAFTGGAIGGLALGTGGRVFNAYRSTGGKRNLAASIAVYEGYEYEQAYELANEIYERSGEGLPFTELYQKVVNPSVYENFSQQKGQIKTEEEVAAETAEEAVAVDKGVSEPEPEIKEQEKIPADKRRGGFADNTPFGDKDLFFDKMADVARDMNHPAKQSPLAQGLEQSDKTPDGGATNKQKARAHIVQKENKISDERYKKMAIESTGQSSIKNMTKTEADRFIRTLQGKRQSLGDEFYKENAGKGKIPVSEKAGAVFEKAKTITAKTVGTMSDRLRKISPPLFQKVKRGFIFKNLHRTSEMVEQVRPFVDGVDAMSREDQQKFELASLIGAPATDDILELVNKYELQEEYRVFRDVMDRIYTMAYSVGMDIDYTPMYFPRSVKNLDGLVNYLKRVEHFSIIETALRNREESAGRPLEEDEKASVINTLMRGYRTQQVSLATPGNVKPRDIAILDKNISPYYHNWKRSLTDYIHGMNTNIAARQFFGKESRDVAKLRGQISRARSRVYKFETGQVEYKDQETFDKKHQDAIDKLGKLEKEFSRKNINFLQDSIGRHVLEEIEAGRISVDQEKELRGIFEGVFAPKGTGAWVQQIQKWGYVSTLSQATNALTQAGELMYSMLESPLQANINNAKAWAGKSNIKLNEITGGIGNVQEWTDAGLDSVAKKLLMGVTKVNDVGFETFVNTVVEKRRAEARANPDKFKKDIEYVYGPETDDLVADLISGKITDNVKYLAFAELSELQPISILEMPEYYAKAGNLRILYMLKTFTIKRMNVLFNTATKDMKSGDPRKVLRGLSRATWMAFWLLMADTSIDVIKDLIRGKTADFADSAIDNVWQAFMLSKYDVDRLAGEGIGGTISNMTKVPTPFGDALLKDMATLADEDSEKGSELARRIPYVGEFYYWWMGEGARKIDEGLYED